MNQTASTTSIPNDFIDIHLPVAKPIYAVVYIYGYRQFSKGARYISCAQLAEAFDTTAERIESIWQYWQNLGLVNILSSQNGILEIAFPNIADEKLTEKEARQEAKLPSVLTEFPEYTIEDVGKLLHDPEVQRLFYTAESLTGKPLSDMERRMYLAFYDDLGLPVDVISVLLEYCVDKGKTHNNYLRTVALDWSERGITTPEEAEEYISLFNNEYREILRFYGVSGRDPIDKEMEYMHRWLKEERYSMQIIKLACERTIMSKARPSFAYTDGIFKKWKQDGISTIEQIEALEKSYYENIKSTRRPAGVGTNNKNIPKSKEGSRFQNYKGRKWDYEKLAQMEQAYLDKKIADYSGDKKQN